MVGITQSVSYFQPKVCSDPKIILLSTYYVRLVFKSRVFIFLWGNVCFFEEQVLLEMCLCNMEFDILVC